MFKHLASLQPMLVSCKVAFIYTPPPTIAYLFAFPSYCPLLVVNGSIEYLVLLDSAQIVPPSKYTELLVKLLVLLKFKVATFFCDVNIATPHFYLCC